MRGQGGVLLVAVRVLEGVKTGQGVVVPGEGHRKTRSPAYGSLIGSPGPFEPNPQMSGSEHRHWSGIVRMIVWFSHGTTILAWAGGSHAIQIEGGLAFIEQGIYPGTTNCTGESDQDNR